MTSSAASADPSLERFFSSGYAVARERFRNAAQARGAMLDTLALTARGPGGAPLAIDIAWLGAPDAPRVLLHTSGIHGVEAYAGSAIQLALLEAPPALGNEVALALVHVLNPYGMACTRRTNENNVDLNRNFLGDGEAWSGAAPLYATLDPLLNPASPPREDAFPWRALACAARHGYGAVKQAVAQGQHDFPRGLFYGGARLEEGPRLYLDWLQRRLSTVFTVLAIDVHTGLGRWGRDTLLVEAGYRAPETLAAALPSPLLDAQRDRSSAYVIRGGLAAGTRRVLPGAAVHGVLQEFGTYPLLRVISALRDENRWHFYGNGGLHHPAKARLLRALAPEDPAWRRKIVARGCALAYAGVEWLIQQE